MGVPRIFVVADDDRVSQHLNGVLAHLGYEIAGTSASGKDAVRGVKTIQPDLVLLDVTHEDGSNGVETARQINGNGFRCPVLFLTSSVDQTVLEQVRSVSPSSYLVKPVEERHLGPAIEAALEKFNLEQQLRQSEQRWAAVADQLQEGIALLDTQGLVVLEVNPAFERMTGYTRAAVIGKPLAEFFEILGTQLESAVEKARRSKHHRVGEQVFYRPDGSQMDAEVFLSFIDHVEPQSICLTLHDISHRKQAERAYQTLVDQSSQALIIIQNNEIVFANPAAEKITGFTSEEMVGHPVSVLAARVMNDNPARVAAFVSRLSHNNVPDELLEVRYQAANSATSWLEIKLERVEFNDHPAVQFIARDITARKSTEEKLTQTEEKYRTVFESAPIGIYKMTLDGHFMMVNPTFARIFGYADPTQMVNSEEALGIAIYPDVKVRAAAVEKTLQSSDFVRLNGQYRRKDGVLITGDLFSRAVRDANGSVSHLEGFFQDVTERRRVEEALKVTQFVMDHAADAIVLTDAQGKLVYYNDAACSSLGYNRSEMAALSVFDIEPHLSSDGWANHWAKIKQEGSIALLTDQRTKDGKLLPVEVTANYLQYQDREFNCISARNIAERRLVEDRLRSSEEKFSKAFHSSPNMMIIHTLREGRIQEANQAFYAVTGFSRDECVGKTFYDLGLFSSKEETRKIRSLLESSGTCRNAEITLTLKNGRLMTGLVSAEMLTLAGENCVLSEVSDVTELKHTEEQLQRQVQRMASLRALEMSITASVDLRLTLQVLLEQVVGQLPIQAADVLLLNSHTQHLEFAAESGFHASKRRYMALPLGEGLAGQAALERRLITVLSTPGNDRYESRIPYEDENFVAYFGIPLIARGRVKGVLELYARNPVSSEPDWLGYLEALAGQAAIAIDNASLFEDQQRANTKLVKAYDDTIEGWARALDLRDSATEGHSRRVAALTVRLATALGIRGEDLVHIRRGALLHDIGKMGIPDAILLKNGPFTPEEWEIMRMHPVYAYELLSPIEFLRPAVDIPYCHHERWDGKGYPRGLKAEQIPLSARIFAVVDVWDSLRTNRPYREAWPKDQVINYLRQQANVHLDATVVETFLNLTGNL